MNIPEYEATFLMLGMDVHYKSSASIGARIRYDSGAKLTVYCSRDMHRLRLQRPFISKRKNICRTYRSLSAMMEGVAHYDAITRQLD